MKKTIADTFESASKALPFDDLINHHEETKQIKIKESIGTFSLLLFIDDSIIIHNTAWDDVISFHARNADAVISVLLESFPSKLKREAMGEIQNIQSCSDSINQ